MCVHVPWSLLFRARWQLGALLNKLSLTILTAGGGHPSRCDQADSPADRDLFQHVDKNGILPPHIAEAFLIEHGRPGQWKAGFAGRCPFGVAVAVLSLAVWMQAGQATVLGGGYIGSGLSAEALTAPLKLQTNTKGLQRARAG